MSFNKICIVGLGYIGLPTAAVFAQHNIKVHGVDINQHAVDMINQGKIHIVEPGLEDVVKSNVDRGFLMAATHAIEADAFLIAVPTPFKNDHEPDLSYIKSACETIAPQLKQGNLVILESTSPVGATEQMSAWLSESRPDLSFPQQKKDVSDIRIAHCPERVLPGKVLEELISNDRIIGGMSPKCSEQAALLYKTFVQGQCIITNARTAEMCKLTENSFRDVNIAFANELSIICDKQNIDVWELIQLANRHPRVNILMPGPGVGGHCIAVDPWFIVAQNRQEAQLIQTARKVNDHKPEWVINKVKLAISDYLLSQPHKTISDITIACYGLSFKPDIDDLRESPALNIALKINEIHQGQTVCVEPNITSLPTFASTLQLTALQSALQVADIHVLLVDHQEFKSNIPTAGIIVDSKGIWKKLGN